MMALFGKLFDRRAYAAKYNHKAISLVRDTIYEIEAEEIEKAKTEKEKEEMRFKIYERQKIIVDDHNNYVENIPLGSAFFPRKLPLPPKPKGYDEWIAKQK